MKVLGIETSCDETSAAIAAAKKSLALAIKAGNKDYEIMNNESIEKWSNWY